MTRHASIFIAMVLGVGLLAGVAGATVTAVGTDTTTGPNWRTAAVLETDNEYGSDGYRIYGIDDIDGQFRNPYAFDQDQTVLPAGVTGIANDAVQMWSGNGNFGTMEDPGNGNAIVNTPLLVLLTAPTTFTISRNAGTSFRLTLLAASGDGANVTYNTSVNDGSGAVPQSSTLTANGLHYHVYDISSGSADVVVSVNAGNHFSLTGLAFDPLPGGGGGGVGWSDTDTTEISTSAARATATVNTNLTDAVLVWDTSDQGEGSTNDWTYRLSLGSQSMGVVTGQMTGLDWETDYVWRMYGENAETNGWSDAVDFTTLDGPRSLYSMEITFTNFAGKGTLTDFPALVKLTTASTHSYTGFLDTTDGYDLRFYDNGWLDGTPLDYEIESFDDSGTSYIWVKVPELTQNTAIWASWGEDATQQASTTNGAVWGSDFTAVWHMGEVSQLALDATSNGHDATSKGGTPASTTGLIADANDFEDGGGDYMRGPDHRDISYVVDQQTISAWIYNHNNGGNEYIFGTHNQGPVFGLNGSDQLVYYNNNSSWEYSGVTIAQDEWVHVAIVYEEGVPTDAYDGKFYVNGEHVGNSVDIQDYTGGQRDWTIGAGGEHWTGERFDGVIDEVRISATARSGEWLYACAMNQGSHDSFVSYGSVQTAAEMRWSRPRTYTVTTNSAQAEGLINTNLTASTLVWATSDMGTESVTNWTWSLSLGAQSTGPVSGLVTGLVADTQYSWRMYGTNATADAWSGEATFSSALSTAQKPVFTNAVPDEDSIRLYWTDNATYETAYVLQRSTNGTDYTTHATLDANTVYYWDTGLAAGTYHYRLSAVNGSNGSSTDSALCATNAVCAGPDVFPANSGAGGAPCPTAGTINPATGLAWAFGDTYHLAFVSSAVDNMSAQENIHYWNDWVKAVANGSSLPGIPKLTWKVIGSDTSTHARDNALVSAPVYRVDGATRIADSYADMWDGSIDATLSKDESNNGVSGTWVWSGTSSSGGGSAGSTSFDGTSTSAYRSRYDQVNSQWIVHGTTGRAVDYRLYGLSQPLTITNGLGGDTTPPEPSTMTWAEPPNGAETNTITMKATLAYDLASPAVEYFFTNTVTHETRGWDVSPRWTNTVAVNTLNTYMVKARDAVGNETAWSATHSATPLNKGPNGLAAPTGLHPATGEPWQVGDTYHLVFVSSTTTNLTIPHDIDFWNDWINSVADGSSLPGVPDLTWKVIGSDLTTHARDNAPVTAPVYLVDATTKIADSYADMWDSTIDANLDMYETGAAGAGEAMVWSGSDSAGASTGSSSFNGTSGNASRGGRNTTVLGRWISQDTRARSGNYRFYGLSQPIGIVSLAGGDVTPPSPSPMTFDVAPEPLTTNSIMMRATLAHDLASAPVQYLFTNTTTSTSSGWQLSPDWVDNVVLGRANTYMVKARDAVGNETAWSASATSKPRLVSQTGVLAPSVINPATGELWTDGETYHLAFVTKDVSTATLADMPAYNAYVNGKADLSDITGVPETTWYIIGSTIATNANANALVSAAVYLLDGTTRIADGYADMWDGSIDNPLNIDEYGDAGSGSGDAWTGTSSDGSGHNPYQLNGTHGNCSRAHRTYANSWWIYRDTQGQTGSRHFYALSEPLTISYTAVDVVNGVASNVSATSADLGGTVSAPVGQTLDVSVYWSTNDNADAAAWLADTSASSAVVGSYTDVVTQQISYATGSVLSPGTVYYYTFRGTNADVTVWASPNTQFGTVGQPAVANVGSTPSVGYATLTGELLSTGGATTTSRIYWGPSNGGDTAASWSNVIVVSSDQAVGEFSANTTNDLVYGVQYYFRVNASSVNGTVWASESVPFLTSLPSPGLRVTDNLQMWLSADSGVTVDGSDTVTAWADQSGNGLTAARSGGNVKLVADQVNGLPAVQFRSNPYANVTGSMFSKQQYVVFSLPNIGGDWGAVLGSTGVRSGYMMHPSGYMWSGNYPEAVRQNGGAELSPNYQLSSVSDFMIVRITGNDGDTSVRSGWRLGRADSWNGLQMNLAEIIVYDTTLSAADEDAVAGYLARKYDITTAYPELVVSEISNEDVEPGYTANEATFNASFSGAGSVFDVYVYWGTNDGANVAGDWGRTNYIGSYTNQAVTNLQYDATGLTADTRYYYAFMAQNLATNLWAQPSATFQTLGSLAVSNSVATHVGYATLSGEVTVGGQADVTIVWGTSDAGTNSGVNAWDNVVPMGNQIAEDAFSTNTIDAWHGITYYTRTYASNVTGEAWSDAIEFYIPKGLFKADTLYRSGYDTEGDDNEMSLDSNGGLLALTPDGAEDFTSGPGNRGMDYNSDADFMETGLFTSSDTFANLWLGYFTAPETGEFRFKINHYGDTSDRGGIWLDLDQDWVFESSAPGLGSDRGEQLAWSDTGEKRVDLEAGRVYRVAFTHREQSGGSGYHAMLRIPSVGYFETVKPADAAQAGLWKYDLETPLELLFENQLVNGISAGEATLNTKFKCEKAAYDVWAYWSTTDGGTNAASWEATGESEYVGSYTNLTAMTDIAHAVSNLLGAQTYYYTFRATNTYTDYWAEPSIDFVSAGPPTVSVNGGASGIGSGVATLNGNLTGGGGADAYICWGLSDGGTNGTETWEYVIPMGPQLEGLAFSNDISGTLYGVEYSYRVLASNGLGSAWSPLDTFWTLVPPGEAVLRVTDGMEAWYDAGVGVDTSGNNVTKWADQSGNGKDTTSVSGTPELSSDEINGRPAIKFRSEHMKIDHAMVPREQYFVFRSGRYHSYPADPHKWGPGGWGGPFGQQNDNGWMLQDGQVYTWNSRTPTDMDQNGTDLNPSGGRYYFTNVGDYFVLRVSPLNYTSANAYIGRPNNSWYNGYLDIAEIIIYSDVKSEADQSQIGGYLAYKYGITTTYSGYTPLSAISVEPTTVSNIQVSSATLGGTLNVTQSVFTATAYWSTNNNTNAVEWLADGDADSALVGTYTNVAGHAISTSAGSLSGATTYYYVFRLSNPQTNVWSAANGTFETAGPPTAGLGGGATNEGIGVVTLRGELIGGGAGDAYICFGELDGGTTSTGNWEHAISIGTVNQGVIFSNTVSNLYYGIEYDYRVFATNEAGSGWSTAGTFTTLPPVAQAGLPVTDNLVVHFDAGEGVTTDGSGVLTWNDQSGNGHHATRASGNPALVASVSEINDLPAIETRGNNDYFNLAGSLFAREHYIVFRSRPDRSTWSHYGGILGQSSGRPSNYLTENNNTTFHGNQYPQDVSRNGTALSAGYSLAPINEYMVVKIRVNTGDTAQQAYQLGRADNYSCDIDVAEIIGYSDTKNGADESQIGGYLAYKYGITTSYTGYEPPVANGIENTAASNIGATTADLGGTLNATNSVFGVVAYWSQNSNANAAAWIADATKGSAHVGVYTNVVGQTVSAQATGMTGGTTYYYTLVATNVSTNIWATPNASFATVGPPVVDVDAATDIGIGTATLRGELTDGNGAYATFCWGPVDGGTTSTSDWAFSASVGFVDEGVVFTNALSNLYYGVEYDYRVYVTNDAGEAWSAVTNFSTWSPLTTSLGVLNWDFETGDLEGWTNVGATVGADLLFRNGNSPVSHTRMSGKQGTWYIDGHTSNAGGSDHHTGIIETEDTFVLGANARWTFVSGGGTFSWSGTPAAPGNLAGIALERETATPGVWENIIFQTGGNNSLLARDHDLSAYEGDTVRIRVYDNTQGGWGFPGVDDLQVTNAVIPSGYTLSIANTAATNVRATTADLGGTLTGDISVFTVHAYYSTNSANSNAAAWLADGDAVSVEVGTYTNASDATLTASVSGLTRGVTYYYTMMAASDVTNLWATPNASFTADGTAPEPDAMTFAIEPAAIDEHNVVMTASTATDALNNPCEYYFDNTNNSDNSGWISSTVWTNGGLTTGTTYGYRVKARDAVSNETAYSAVFTATPAGDVVPPTPNPLTWVAPPAAVDNTTIVMTITNATDPNGPVTYEFENVTNSISSGWISGTTWTNTGLTNGSVYGYRVRAQDGIGNKTAWSTTLSTWCAPLRWDANATGADQTDGAGNWLDAGQWWNGTTNVVWQNAYRNNAAIGSGGTAGAITLGDVIAGSVTFTNFSGTYTVDGGGLTVDNELAVDGENVTINSPIGGSGSVGRSGSGTLTLRGTNTYTGGTVLSGGIIDVTRDYHLGAADAAITFNGSATLRNNDGTANRVIDLGARPIALNNSAVGTIYLGRGDTFNTTGAVTGDGGISVTCNGGNVDYLRLLNANNTFTGPITLHGGNCYFKLELNSLADSFNPITFNGGNVTFIYKGDADLTLNNRPLILNASAYLDNSSSYDLTINASTTIGGTGNKTLTLQGSGDSRLAGDISEGSSTLQITKSGSGTWSIGGNNSYSGLTKINDSGRWVYFQNASDSVPAASTMWIGGSAGMRLLDDDAGVINMGNGVQIGVAGTGERDGPTIFVGNNNTANGGFSSGSTTGSTIAMGVFDLTHGDQRSSQRLTFTGANGYRLLMGGLLIHKRADRGGPYLVPTSASVTITGIVTQASGKLATDSTAGDVLELRGTTTDNLISAVIQDAADYTDSSNPDAVPFNLLKTETGEWTLSGTNTYTGTTTVNQGKLVVSGSLAGGGAVSVSGGLLSGTGTIGGAVTLSGSGGIELRDSAVGTLTLGNGLAINGAVDANDLFFDLGTGGNGTDKIVVTGDVTMATSGAGVITLNQLSGTKINTGTYALIAATGAMPAVGNFTLATTAAFGNTFSLQVTGSTLELVVASAAAAPAAAFWKGAGADDNWSTVANWVDGVGDPLSGVPGYETDVSIHAAGAARLTTGALDADFDINSLTYVADATANTTIGGSTKTLILEAGSGITVNTPSSGTPTHTISANIGIATSQTWNVASGPELHVSGVIGDFGGGNSLTKTGAGTQRMSGLNTYSGATVIDEGALEIWHYSLGNSTVANALGMSSAAAGNLVLEPGTTLRFIVSGDSYKSTDRSFTINGTVDGHSATIESERSGGSGWRGVRFTTATSPAYGTPNQTRTLILAGDHTGNANLWNRIDANIADNGSGAVSLVKNGGGYWGLGGSCTYSGGTTINGGRLRMGKANALPTAGAVILADTAGAILDLTLGSGSTSYDQTIGSLSGGGSSGGNVSLGNATLTVGDATSTTYAGVISGIAGVGNLVKQGAGALTLTAAQTYQGDTTVNAGKLVIAGSLDALNDVAVAGGALAGTGTVNGDVTLSGTGGIDLQDSAVGTLTIGDNLAINGAAGANDLTFDLGNGAGGTDKITVGGDVTIMTDGAAVINLNQLSGTKIDAGTYDLIDATGAMESVDEFSLATSSAFGNNFALQVTGSTLQVVVTSAASAPAVAFWDGSSDNNWSTVANWATNAAGAGTVSGAPGYITDISFYATGAGRLTTGVLDTDFDVNSLTYVADATADTVIGGSPNSLILEAGSGITVNTPSSATPTHTISANVAMATNQSWAVESGAALTVSGNVGDLGGGNALTKGGAGTLTLSGTNTYSGATTVNGGTVVIGNVADGGAASGLGQSSAAAANLVLGNGTTLRYECGGTLLSTDRGFTINGTAAGHSATIESASVGAGSLRGISFTSTASPAYGSANQARTLILDGTFAAAGVHVSYFNKFAANIADNGSGAVSVTKTGTGSWGLLGANTFTGGLSVEQGTLLLRAITAAGSGVVTVGSAGNSATLDLNGGQRTVLGLATAGTAANQTITSTAPGGILHVAGATTSTFGGVIAGSTASYTALTVDNAAASLTLSGASTYAGATTVEAGTLLVNGSLAAGSMVTVKTGGTLGGADGTIGGPTTVQSGGTLAPGAGGTGTVTFGGDLSLNSGSTLAMELGTSSDQVRVTSGTFAAPAAGTVTIDVSNAGGLAAGNYVLIDWSGATPSSVDASDFAVTMPGGSLNGAVSVVGNSLVLTVTNAGPTGSIFRFR